MNVNIVMCRGLYRPALTRSCIPRDAFDMQSATGETYQSSIDTYFVNSLVIDGVNAIVFVHCSVGSSRAGQSRVKGCPGENANIDFPKEGGLYIRMPTLKVANRRTLVF